MQDRGLLAEMQGAEQLQLGDVDVNNKLLFHLPHRGLWTKLRPGVHELLSELEELYDLHVYTMGDRVYAHEMASLLDTSGQRFKNKIISRNDSANERQKDPSLLLGAEDMLIIVDDTVCTIPQVSTVIESIGLCSCHA